MGKAKEILADVVSGAGDVLAEVDETPASEVAYENAEKVSTDTSEVGKMTMDEYLKLVTVNPGLIASLRVELQDKYPSSEEDWRLAFEAQSNKMY